EELDYDARGAAQPQTKITAKRETEKTDSAAGVAAGFGRVGAGIANGFDPRWEILNLSKGLHSRDRAGLLEIVGNYYGESALCQILRVTPDGCAPRFRHAVRTVRYHNSQAGGARGRQV